jgi:hypothetical protein
LEIGVAGVVEAVGMHSVVCRRGVRFCLRLRLDLGLGGGRALYYIHNGRLLMRQDLVRRLGSVEYLKCGAMVLLYSLGAWKGEVV